jgi:hypothetical protein
MQFEIEIELSGRIGSSNEVETRRFAKSVEMPDLPKLGHRFTLQVGEQWVVVGVKDITRNVEDGIYRVSVTTVGLTFASLRQDKSWSETLL